MDKSKALVIAKMVQPAGLVKYEFSDVARCFDKLDVPQPQQYLGGKPVKEPEIDEWYEEDLAMLGPGPVEPKVSAAPAGARPVPAFPETKSEPGLSSTIPWATPAKRQREAETVSVSTASQPGLTAPCEHDALLANGTLQYHPPAHLQPMAPLAPVGAPAVLHQHQVTVWCQQDHLGVAVPISTPAVVLNSNTRGVDRPPAARTTNSASGSLLDEKSFEAGLRRMVTRSELHRMAELKKKDEE